MDKKLRYILIGILLIVSLIMIPLKSGMLIFADGDDEGPVQEEGPEIDDLQIGTYEELLQVAINVNKGIEPVRRYTLTKDILINIGDFDEDGNYTERDNEPLREFIPIGTPEHPFRGTFYGNSRKIQGLYINSGDSDYVGLFGYTEFATIYDFILRDAYVNGNRYVGSVVGYSYGGNVSNIILEDVIVKGNQDFGNIVGINVTTENITTAEQLVALATYVNGGGETTNMTYILQNDIVFNETKFTLNGDYTDKETFIPIGRDDDLVEGYDVTEYSFRGVFDGNGHKITGLYIDREKVQNAGYSGDLMGFFGNVCGATIRNLVIENSYISGEKNMAVLVGNMQDTTIENVTINTSFVNGVTDLAGMVCNASMKLEESKILNSYVNVVISGRSSIGGYISTGYFNSIKNSILIENCYSNCNIKLIGGKNHNDNTYIGGFVANATSVKIYKCTNNGKIEDTPVDSGYSTYRFVIGGFVGEGRDIRIENSTNLMDLFADYCVGGFIGYEHESVLSYCVNKAKICGYENVGGIVGLGDNGTAYKCENYGSIYGANSVGGIAGCKFNVESSKAECNIYAINAYYHYSDEDSGESLLARYNQDNSSNIGGLVGLEDGTANNSYVVNDSKFIGNIEALKDTESENVGGAVGYMTYTIVANTSIEGTLTVYGNHVGGAVGYVDTGYVVNSYTNIEITYQTSLDYGGGLVGYMDATTIDNSFVMNTCQTTDHCGIIVGETGDNNTIISIYYLDTLGTGEINGLDDENCTPLGYSKFIMDTEDSLVNLLNVRALEFYTYNTWGYGDTNPIYLVITARIYYDINGGNGIFNDETVYLMGDMVTIDFVEVPNKANHTFMGYILNDDETTLYTTDNPNIVLNEEVNILKAVWQENLIEDIYVLGYDDIALIYNYDELEHGINVQGTLIDDRILYSADGITYSENQIKYSVPGDYTIYFKILRDDYFEYVSYAKMKINKADIDVSGLKWQREWYITSLSNLEMMTITDKKFTYNSYENTITLIESTLPREITGVEYYVDNVQGYGLTCKNAGFYSVTAKLLYDETLYNSFDNNIVFSFEIEKYIVSKPYANSTNTFTYTGSNITFVIKNDNSSDIYTYTTVGDVNTSAGNYTAVCSIIDKQNFAWSDGTNEDITFDYTINKKEIAIPTVTTTDFRYDGRAHKLAFTAYSDLWSVLNNNEQTNVGNYTCVVYIIDTKNYKFENTEKTNISFTMNINPLVISKPVATNTKFNYDGRQKTLSIATSDNYIVLNNSGMVAGEYTALISLKDKINTVWSDGTTDSYNIEFTIAKRKIDVPQINSRFTYTGLEHRVELDTSNDYVVYNNSRTLAGEQNMILSLVDKANTEWSDETSDDKIFKLIVDEAKIQVNESDIVVELVDDELRTNLSNFAVEGAKILYSTSKDGKYTKKLIFDTDGEYLVYYKIIADNFKEFNGSFVFKRDLDGEKTGNSGLVVAIIIVIILILLGGGFVFVCYTRQLLFFKPKAKLETENKNKKLAFEKHEDKSEKEEETKEEKPKSKPNMSTKLDITGMSEDLEKARQRSPMMNFKERLKRNKVEDTSEKKEETKEEKPVDEKVEDVKQEVENKEIPVETPTEEIVENVEPVENVETKTEETKVETEEVENDVKVEEEVEEQETETDKKSNVMSIFKDKINSIVKKGKKDEQPDVKSVNVRPVDDDDEM